MTLTGTPIELEAQLRNYFDAMRTYLGVCAENADWVRPELFERTVFEVGVRALDGLAHDRARPFIRATVDRIDIERELFDLVSRSDAETGVSEHASTV